MAKFLGSIKADGRPGRVRLYYDEHGAIIGQQGDEHWDAEIGAFVSFEQAAEAALTAWSGPEWDFKASAAVSRLFGGIIRRS